MQNPNEIVETSSSSFFLKVYRNLENGINI